jgi:hypothetical protein
VKRLNMAENKCAIIKLNRYNISFETLRLFKTEAKSQINYLKAALNN